MKRSVFPLVALALAGCGRGAGPNPPAPDGVAVPPAERAARVEAGRRIYNFRCYFCHGYSGDARTLAASYLAPPPRDFTSPASAALSVAAIAKAVREGRPGTAMKSFAGILDESETLAVATFVVDEFVDRKARNTAYHTPENGWRDHERFRDAFAFATGALPLDGPWEELTPAQARGKRLYLTTCVSCHDRARVRDEGPIWTTRPLSYPRAGFVYEGSAAPVIDAVTGASPYAKHDVPPQTGSLTKVESRGRRLYQANCAFCHAADGTGANWIGRFMQPPARNLTSFSAATMPRPRLVETIRNGIDGTSMPAWRNVLTPAEIDAIAAYVTRAFLAPPAASAPPPG